MDDSRETSENGCKDHLIIQSLIYLQSELVSFIASWLNENTADVVRMSRSYRARESSTIMTTVSIWNLFSIVKPVGALRVLQPTLMLESQSTRSKSHLHCLT